RGVDLQHRIERATVRTCVVGTSVARVVGTSIARVVGTSVARVVGTSVARVAGTSVARVAGTPIACVAGTCVARPRVSRAEHHLPGGTRSRTVAGIPYRRVLARPFHAGLVVPARHAYAGVAQHDRQVERLVRLEAQQPARDDTAGRRGRL